MPHKNLPEDLEHGLCCRKQQCSLVLLADSASQVTEGSWQP